MILKRDEEIAMKRRLIKIQQSGVNLYLEGKPASPQSIAFQCVKEELIYMPDFVTNDNGKLMELRYDLIKEV